MKKSILLISLIGAVVCQFSAADNKTKNEINEECARLMQKIESLKKDPNFYGDDFEKNMFPLAEKLTQLLKKACEEALKDLEKNSPSTPSSQSNAVKKAKKNNANFNAKTSKSK